MINVTDYLRYYITMIDDQLVPHTLQLSSKGMPFSLPSPSSLRFSSQETIIGTSYMFSLPLVAPNPIIPLPPNQTRFVLLKSSPAEGAHLPENCTGPSGSETVSSPPLLFSHPLKNFMERLTCSRTPLAFHQQAGGTQGIALK